MEYYNDLSIETVIYNVFNACRCNNHVIEKELLDAAKKAHLMDRLICVRMDNPVNGHTDYMELGRYKGSKGMFTLLDDSLKCYDSYIYDAFSNMVHDVIESMFGMTFDEDEDVDEVTYYAVHGKQFMDMLQSLKSEILGLDYNADSNIPLHSYRLHNTRFMLMHSQKDVYDDYWFDTAILMNPTDICDGSIYKQFNGDELEVRCAFGDYRPFNDVVEVLASLIWKRLKMCGILYDSVSDDVTIEERMKRLQAFKVPVKLMINNNGIYQYKDVEVSCPAMDADEARRKVNDNLEITFSTGTPRMILPETSPFEDFIEAIKMKRDDGQDRT